MMAAARRAYTTADLNFRSEGSGKREQRTNFKIARRNIEPLSDIGPLFQVSKAGPPRDAVVNDEKILARVVGRHYAIP